MRAGTGIWVLALALVLLAPAAPAGAQGDDARYALVHGCYALKSQATGQLVAKDGGGYRASAADAGGAEGFRMHPTALGRYLFFGRQSDFMAAGSGDTVETASAASQAADWQVDVQGGAFRITSLSADRILAVAPDGSVVTAEGEGAGDRALFTFEAADGCAVYPEAQVNATGEPSTGASAHSEVRGLIDAHLHLMAYEFLGGSVRCGQPWHPYGIAFAMVDCPDHGPGGVGAVLENVLSTGSPVGTHDTVGWPTFKDWPRHNSLTHEGIYWKGLERAWRGGLRLFVNLLVDNAVLCELYPLKEHPCDEMATARLELQRTRELQDYIDAQSGGPGKGWFRIVTSPFEARRVINEGKLAVVIGMETSRLFDCTLNNGVAECDREQIDRYLDEFHAAGVRSLELVNKFDNALSGVAGDGGNTGVVVNSGNRYETGRYWDFEQCDGGEEDKPQHALPGTERDALAGGFASFVPPGVAPVYPSPPHCNTIGLSDLGDYLIRRMAEKKMILDPDHMSVLGRNHALSLLEALDYSGVVSSHSWSTEPALPRIYALGGTITPYAGDSTTFVEAWREWKQYYSGQQYFGFGYGSDMNGFGAQGGPRSDAGEKPVNYPFKSFDGAVTLDRQVWGERTWDVNEDGASQYGLYPDWVEDLRVIAGDEIVEDMARGAEAYLQMWERAEGIPANHCRSQRARFTARGIGRVRLGATHRRALRRAGQPEERGARVWRWCVLTREDDVVAVLTPRGRIALIASTAPAHRAQRIGRGDDSDRLDDVADRFARRLFVREARGRGDFVYGVRKGRVRFVAVASRAALKNRRALRRYVRLAGLR